MSALREGMERAEARVTRGAEMYEIGRLSDRVPLMCVGTDVRGLELAEQVGLDSEDLVERVEAGDDLGQVMRGALVRWFWLGYEMRGED